MWNSLLAIAAGALVDQLGSWFGVAWIETALYSTGLPFPPAFWVGVAIAGWLGMDVIGGFVTGCIAKSHKMRHAAVTGLIMFGVSWGLIHFKVTGDPWDTFCLATMIPCEIFGGWLAMRRGTPKARPPRGPAPPIASPN